jgi:hypothetical protein
VSREQTNAVEVDAQRASRSRGTEPARSAPQIGEPVPAPARLLFSLQQSAGNRAVSGLVHRWRSADAGLLLETAPVQREGFGDPEAATPRFERVNRAAGRLVPAPRSAPATVQRFAVTDNPIDWNEAKKAEASQEGATGVFFVSDPKNVTLVAKFLTSDEAARALFARRIFERLKVATPMAKALNATETATLRAKLEELSKNSDRENRFRDVLRQGAGKIALVAAKVEDAQSLYGRLVNEAKQSGEGSERPKHELELLRRLLNRSEIGVFLAADAFLGNKDRVEAANLGNIMVGTKDAVMHAIDNDTLAIALSYEDDRVAARDAKEWSRLILEGAAVGSGMTGLQALSNDAATRHKQLVKVLGNIKARLGTSGSFDRGAVSSLQIQDVAQAWEQGIATTKQMLTSMTDKKSRTELKEEFRNEAPGGPSARYAWPALRVRLKYLELQQQQVPPEQIPERLAQFVADHEAKWRLKEQSIVPKRGAEEAPPKPAALGPSATTVGERGGVPKLTLGSLMKGGPPPPKAAAASTEAEAGRPGGVPKLTLGSLIKGGPPPPKAAAASTQPEAGRPGGVPKLTLGSLIKGGLPESSGSGPDPDNDDGGGAGSREDESSEQSPEGSTG